jgi:hypothetical protein
MPNKLIRLILIRPIKRVLSLIAMALALLLIFIPLFIFGNPDCFDTVMEEITYFGEW